MWEYKVIQLTQYDVYNRPLGEIEQRLNKLGAEGWEIASTAAYPESATVIFLKRPVAYRYNNVPNDVPIALYAEYPSGTVQGGGSPYRPQA